MSGRSKLAFDQYGITKLMCAVTLLAKGCGNSTEHRIISERPEELKMALAGLVHSRKNRIHHAQPRFSSDASARDAISGRYAAIGICGGLEGSDHGRSDRHDATILGLRLVDRRCGSLRDAVRLV